MSRFLGAAAVLFAAFALSGRSGPRRRPPVPPGGAGENGGEVGTARLVYLGDVREVVLGNSHSGNSDANSQFYW